MSRRTAAEERERRRRSQNQHKQTQSKSLGTRPKPKQTKPTSKPKTSTVTRNQTPAQRNQGQAHKRFVSTAPSRGTTTGQTRSAARTRGQQHKVYSDQNTYRNTVVSGSSADLTRDRSKYRQRASDRPGAKIFQNTGAAAKKGIEDRVSGWKKTALDIGEMASKDERSIKTQARRQGIKLNDEKRMSEIQAEHTKAAQTAKKEREKEDKIQQERQEEFDERTKGASGAEKALYGAVESGAGMLADLAVGAATGTGAAGSLASLGVGSYGQTRGSAKRAGATENEDRVNALLQAGKEVATERIFAGIGLAKGYAGKSAMSLSDRAAAKLTSKLTGRAANLVGAGARLAGGVAEENLEEAIGWAADPLISEASYEGRVRRRRQDQIKEQLKAESDDLRSQIKDENTARSMATYLSSNDFLEANKKEYMDAGLSEKKATAMAEQMRDYLTASLTGDTDEMERIEQEMATSIAGKGLSASSWNFGELADTAAATTLLTATTGLPGAMRSSAQGAEMKARMGEDGIKALAKTAIDFEDKEMAEKAELMTKRIESGKEITDTEAYDLQQGIIRQQQKDQERMTASWNSASTQIDDQNLVSPIVQDEDGSVSIGKVTSEAVKANTKTAKSAIQAINKENKDNTKLHLSAREVQTGADAIAAFQSGIMTADDANALTFNNKVVRQAFEEQTGVDLSQYIVRKKNGEVDVPATNAATKDALFVLASENLVASAQAETVEWMDNTKGEVVTGITSRMGANGTVALQQALDTVDERNQSEYMLMANATDYLYQSGRNKGQTWDEVSSDYTEMFPEIDPSVLKAAYKAGLDDRQMAEDKLRGRAVEVGKPMSEMGEQETATGNLFVDTKKALKGTEIRLFTELAKQLGVDIHLVDHIKTNAGEANGAFNPKTNTFYINVSTGAETNFGYIFMHELTHYLKVNAPEQYLALENLVREKWFDADASQMQDAIAKKVSLYKGEQSLTEEEALEEIIADAAHEFLNDRNFAKQVAEEDPTIAKALLDCIRKALRMLRNLFTVDGLTRDDTHMNALFSQLDILTDAEALWLDAYKAAVRNRGNRAIEAMHEESIRNSISETEDEEFVTLSPERVDSLISEYAIPGNADSDYSKAWIATINPRDFLKLTVRDNVLDTWEVGTTNEWGQEVRELDKDDLQNTRLMPFLKIDTGESHSVIGHEGRHRMLALYRAGYTEVPVVIQDINEATKNNKQPMEDGEGTDLWSQDFGDGAINGDASIEVYDTIPINEKNRSEIERVYGSTSEDQVRFSVTPEQDADYMKAVEDGDMDAAQKMVDQAAKKAGYNVETFHGTYSKFNKFKRNSHFGTQIYQALDRLGFYNDIIDEYEDDPEVAELLSRAEESGANVMRLYIKASNPLETSDFGAWDYDYLVHLLPEYLPNAEIEWDSLNNVSDVVSALKSEGYDSIVYENLGEGRYEDEGDNDAYILFDPHQAKLADPVTYDNKGNVIPLSERFNESNEDIRYSISEADIERLYGSTSEDQVRFSMSEPVERVKDLIAVHNLREDDLKGALDLGGFPMPSIAVTKDSMGHDMYGDISLLFHSDTINPEKSRKNKVYGGDAYTPTFPEVRKKLDEKVRNSVQKKMESILGLKPYTTKIIDGLQMPSLDEDNVGDRLRYHDPYEAYKDEEAFKIAYLKNSKNFDIAIPTKSGNLRGEGEEFWSLLDDSMPSLSHDDLNVSAENLINKYKPTLTGALGVWYDKKYARIFERHPSQRDDMLDIGYADVDKYLRGLIKYREEGIPSRVDDEKLKEILDEKVDEAGYKKWIEDLFDGIVEKTGIRNNKDMFTPSGNRRKWETLHDPVTLGNVVKVMSAELSAGGNGLFGANPKGAAQKEYKSINEIRADKDRLQQLPDEEYERLSQEALDKFVAVCQSIYSHNEDEFSSSFGGALDIGEAIAETLNQTRTKAGIQKELRKWWTVSDNEMNDLMEAIDAIANVPTGYFEAKPKRAVRFDEVKAAIVPEGFPDHLKAQLSNYGTNIYEYDPEVEGDRTQKINDAASENDLRFSISNKYDDAYMDAVNSGNMDEAQRLVDEAAKAAGMSPMHMYHGSMNANFTVFDKSYAKVGGNSGAGFYFSTNMDDSADHYADVEGADNYFKWSELAEAIWDTGELPDGTDIGDEINSYEDAQEYAKNYLNRSPGTFDVYLNYKTPYVRDYRNSTNIFDKIMEDYDESEVDRDDYDSDEDYEDAVFEHRSDYIYEAISQAVYDANSDLEGNYEVIYGPQISEIASSIAEKAYDYESLTWDDIHDALYQLGETMVTNDNWTEDADATAEFTRAIIENFGYDAIQDKEVSTKFGQLSREMQDDTEHVIVFNPEQIKLSDPVTYAEDGSVIPLSERFDPNNNDIRYSMPTQDSEGNILTDGQMEFFKDSLARDEQGRLMPLYHGTQNGGFTIFDSRYGISSRYFFFVDSMSAAKGYSGSEKMFSESAAGEEDMRLNYKVYLDMVSPLIVDAQGNSWVHIPYEDDFVTTNWLAEYAESEGYDGVIVKNVIDRGSADTEYAPQTDYIVFSSNQIKDINNENPTEDDDIRFSITPEDEALEWLATQYEIDDVPLEDEVAEEGRVRMAKSKEEFINSRHLLWNERWLTEGKVLKDSSVEGSIRQLVMANMENSDTDRKYKTELVDKLVVKAKSAFWLLKDGKDGEAAELLWDSARDMIENVDFVDDTAFNQYKGLRDYLRNTSFRVGEEYWQDVNYREFRKKNFGRIKLVKGDTNVDSLYHELSQMWPEWFDENEQLSVPDQLLHIEEVLDAIQPYKYAYSSEEAAALATDIASDLFDIVYEGKEYSSIADEYKNRYDEKTKAMKARHKEALRKVKEAGDLKVLKEKAKFKEYKEKQKNTKEKAKHFGSIQKNIDWLTERLVHETKDKNIPEPFRRSLAHLLMQFDMQTERSKKLEAKYGVAKKTLQMRELKRRFEEIAREDDTGEFEYNGYLFYLMDALADKVDGETIDALDTEDLIVIDTMLKAIVHNFRNYTKAWKDGKQVEIAEIGDKTIEAMDARIKKYGQRKTRTGLVGMLDKLVNEGEETPIYLFDRLDPKNEGIGAMYKEMRRGEDKHIQNMAFLRERFGAMFSDYFNKKKPGSALEKWRDGSQEQTFDLKNGSITLNPAQIMSLYCLSKRPQALGHILGAGIVASPVNVGQKLRESIRGKAEQVNSVMVTYDEVQQIISTLTPEQKKLADEMQSLMNNEMAAWGNETSMKLHGIRMFREKNYFPIRSSNESLTKTADSFNTQEKIKNFGFTKPLVQNANNAIMVDDIFSVVADHCNKMSLYNAMAVPISDFMRVYNYKQRNEDGSTKTVQQAIGEAYTRKVNDYIMKFIGDVNSNTKTRSDAVNDLMNKALANYKRASIGLNMRVALQQPTAIFRSFMVIDPKWFVGVVPSKKAMDEMFEHCPIALWKSWGHYDMDMGRDIEDVMMNNDWSVGDVASMGLYGALDNVTWSIIWQAVKKEVKANNPSVEVGSDEFWKLCNDRASEVFDKTQVVDSIFHRSDVMRSKNTLTKMAVSFMAEPTLTWNVFRDSLAHARDMLKDGDIAGAGKILMKMTSVLALNAMAVSGAAAIWDAVRGKSDDDDDEEKKFSELWFENFIKNLGDNANLINNIYFVSDVLDIWEGVKLGWGGTSNMALEGFETFFRGIEQFRKKANGEYKEWNEPTWYDIFMNIGGGLGYITGKPIKTFMRDAKAIGEKLNVPVFAADGTAAEVAEEADGWLEKLREKLPKLPKLPEISFGNDSESSEESEESSESDIEAKVEEYKESLGDEYTEDQKKSLAKQYKKTLVSESAEEAEESKEDDTKYQLEMISLKAEEKANEYTGDDLDEKLWDVVSDGYTKRIAKADFSYISKMREIYVKNGGDVDKFDEKIMKQIPTAYKKLLSSDMSKKEIKRQELLKEYMLSHGVSDAEISDMCYHTYMASDLKAAIRMNNEEYIMDELVPLVRAGLSLDDFHKIVKYVNYGAKSYDGKYSDPKYKQSTGTYVWPAQGPITSYFGYRNAPTAGASSNHPAIDIGASQGSPVVAADGGTVISAGNAGGYGNQVAIQHENGAVTYYSHLYGWNVKVGDQVSQGQQIGQVGSTGISTGPHLDFKVTVNGEPVDPLKYLSK